MLYWFNCTHTQLLSWALSFKTIAKKTKNQTHWLCGSSQNILNINSYSLFSLTFYKTLLLEVILSFKVLQKYFSVLVIHFFLWWRLINGHDFLCLLQFYCMDESKVPWINSFSKQKCSYLSWVPGCEIAWPTFTTGTLRTPYKFNTQIWPRVQCLVFTVLQLQWLLIFYFIILYSI